MDRAGLATLQRRLDASPFNAWLGVRLHSGGDGKTELSVPWRDTFISTPERQAVHGGVLATLVDVGAIYALITTGEMLYATVDLRIDYHGLASVGALLVRGRVIRAGRSLSTSEAEVFDCRDRLVASGRGTFLALGQSAMVDATTPPASRSAPGSADAP